MSWLNRYQSGDRAGVWHEIRQRGARLSTAERSEAGAVCDEMAHRARHNIETLVARLTDAGYRFHDNSDEQTQEVPFRHDAERAGEVLEWLQQEFEAIPLTVQSWLRIVGDVWLVGTHPDWLDSAAADPLVVELEGSRYPASGSIVDYFAEELAAWREQCADDPYDCDLFVLPCAPDALHKDNVSGGPPYGLVLPDDCADALWSGATQTSFVSYLNAIFSDGGFPGRTNTSATAWQIKRDLSVGLLPL